MFSMIRGVLFLLLCLVGIGLYRGWFSLTSASPDPQTNRVNISLSLDKSKITADVDKAEQRILEKVAQRLQDRSGGTATQEVK